MFRPDTRSSRVMGVPHVYMLHCAHVYPHDTCYVLVYMLYVFTAEKDVVSKVFVAIYIAVKSSDISKYRTFGRSYMSNEFCSSSPDIPVLPCADMKEKNDVSTTK